MALPSTRYEYRLTLHHIDRGIEHGGAVIAARHPSETAEHLALRVLAFCLLYQDGIGFGPDLSDPDNADLIGRDLIGRVSLWVECGATSAEKLRKIVQHNPEAAVHVVFGGARKRQELLDEVAALRRPQKGLGRVTLWTVDAGLLDALARREERRQTWSVTVVGDHLYVEAAGVTLDGAVEREGLPAV